MSRRKQCDLISGAFNDITYNMGKERYNQLSKKHINTIVEYDAFSKINGAGVTTRKNQIRFLIDFAIKTHKSFEEISKKDITMFLVKYNGGTLENYKAHLKKFFKWMEKPELTKDFKRGRVANNLSKEDLWSEDEIIRLLSVVDPKTRERDQCMVMMLYDMALERRHL